MSMSRDIQKARAEQHWKHMSERDKAEIFVSRKLEKKTEEEIAKDTGFSQSGISQFLRKKDSELKLGTKRGRITEEEILEIGLLLRKREPIPQIARILRRSSSVVYKHSKGDGAKKGSSEAKEEVKRGPSEAQENENPGITQLAHRRIKKERIRREEVRQPRAEEKPIAADNLKTGENHPEVQKVIPELKKDGDAAPQISGNRADSIGTFYRGVRLEEGRTPEEVAQARLRSMAGHQPGAPQEQESGKALPADRSGEARRKLIEELNSIKPISEVERFAAVSNTQSLRNLKDHRGWPIDVLEPVEHSKGYDVYYRTPDGLVEIRGVNSGKPVFFGDEKSNIYGLHYNNEQYPVATLVTSTGRDRVMKIPLRTDTDVKRLGLVLSLYPDIPFGEIFAMVRRQS